MEFLKKKIQQLSEHTGLPEEEVEEIENAIDNVKGDIDHANDPANVPKEQEEVA